METKYKELGLGNIVSSSENLLRLVDLPLSNVHTHTQLALVTI